MHGGCPDHIPTAEELLARKLKPGERILWKSRPAERYWTFPVARRMFFGTILLVYPWCFILAVWRDAGHFWEGELPGSLLYFSLAGVIAGGIPAMLALAGGVRLLSAPWRERTSRRNSLYALTDRRLIAITGEAALFFKGCSIYTRSFHKLRHVRLHPARNGAGDIILEYGGKKKVILREAARPQEAVDILKRLGQKQSSAEQEK